MKLCKALRVHLRNAAAATIPQQMGAILHCQWHPATMLHSLKTIWPRDFWAGMMLQSAAMQITALKMKQEGMRMQLVTLKGNP